MYPDYLETTVPMIRLIRFKFFFYSFLFYYIRYECYSAYAVQHSIRSRILMTIRYKYAT